MNGVNGISGNGPISLVTTTKLSSSPLAAITVEKTASSPIGNAIRNAYWKESLTTVYRDLLR